MISKSCLKLSGLYKWPIEILLVTPIVPWYSSSGSGCKCEGHIQSNNMDGYVCSHSLGNKFMEGPRAVEKDF